MIPWPCSLQELMLRILTLYGNHGAPVREPPPDGVPLPVEPDKGPVPDPLPEDPEQEKVIHPHA
jgi:hypothetical protein